MAEIKKYLDTTALGTLVDQIKAEDAKALAAAKKYTDDSVALCDEAGAASTAESNAKAYTDQLANGAVAANTAAIATLNGTGDGSVAKAVADAKALVDADVDAVETIANQNKTDIAAINNAETGILKQSKDYTDTQVSGVQEDVDNLAELVGEIPAGYEATTIAEYAKELADNVAANGYDDTALAAKVSANESAITALQTKDTELVAKDEELAASIAAVKEDVDTFFKDADLTASAKDTLKEIQEYINSDASAAAEMTASIQQNAQAITALQTADGEQDTKIAALEAKFGGEEGTVEDMIDDAKQEAIDTAAGDATTKANTAESNAKAYTDTEVGKDRARLDVLEAIEHHEHSNKTVLDGITEAKVADWDDAVAKEHTHSNATVLDGITAEKVTAWDTVSSKASQADLDSAVERIAQNETDIEALQTASATHALNSDLTAAVGRIAANETAIAANTSAINSFTAITSAEVEALFA